MLIAFTGIAFAIHENKPRGSSDHKLKQIAAVDLPGPAGKRFDYLTIDYKDHYLLSAHLGAGLLYVINLKNNTLVKAISGVAGVEGVEYVPQLDKVYTSDWFDHSVGVIDLQQMKIIKKITLENKPDGSAYASQYRKLYVSDERAKKLFVIDVYLDSVVKTISFESETGMPRYDSVAQKVYVNLQDENTFAVIDPSTDSVIGRYPVGRACIGNHGMALDVQHRLAFLCCEESNMLTPLSLVTYKPVANIKLPSGGDVVKYDPGLKRIYVACYSGYISIIHEDDSLHFTKLEDFKVQHKVHSLAVDVITHRIYAPEQQENGKAVSRMIIYDAVK